LLLDHLTFLPTMNRSGFMALHPTWCTGFNTLAINFDYNMKRCYTFAMSLPQRLFHIVRAGRPNQWIKNLIVYTAILFNAKLFELPLLVNSTFAFIILCMISSASYMINDIIDAPLDRLHPTKKNRPIASGKVSMQDATFVLFLLIILALTSALFLRIGLAIIIIIFFGLHVTYSLYLKKHILFDLFGISLSFMLRLFAGEVVTGYHVPIWLWLTTFFFALFIASVKRHSEFINQGTKTRPALKNYSEQLFLFLVNSFSVLAIVSYSMYAFVEKPPHIGSKLSGMFQSILRTEEPRKWFTLTVPLVVFGVSRYAQLLYEKRQGEQPERIITRDFVLMATILVWGILLVGLIYIF
ncbi:MAG: UbiA prenyltransferase family protein, partial [Patescibacteria group bacterium]